MSNFPDLHRYPYVVWDFETTGLSWWKDKIFGVAIATPDGKSGYFDVRDNPNTLNWLREEIPRCPLLVAHNAKYETHFAREAGIIVPEGKAVCTMVDAALIDEHLMAYDLDALGNKYVGVGKDQAIWAELAQIFGGKPTRAAQIGNLNRAPVELAARYARQDATTTLKLYEWQRIEIDRQHALDKEDSPERAGFADVVALERALLPVLCRMEQRGIRVDVNKAEQLINIVTADIDTKYTKMRADCGTDFNINSPVQLRALFKPAKDSNGQWRTEDGTLCQETDGGKPSLDSPVLRKMKDPRGPAIVDLRAALKMRDTFLHGHIVGNARSHADGTHTVHCNFNQCRSENELGTITGRLSANSPALHQIHKRDKTKAELVRGLFLPYHQQRWLTYDWDQFEFRVFAHYVDDPEINETYHNDPDTDFHGLVAAMTGLPRSPRFPGDGNAKQINLGLVFGMGQGRLAAEMGLPHTVEHNSKGKEYLLPGDEAVAVFEKYHAKIPGISHLLGSASGVAKRRGYVRTAMGRHIRFPHKIGSHKAGGLIFQGTSADSMKQKLIEIDAYTRTFPEHVQLLLSVHDEVDLSVTEDRQRARQLALDMQQIMQTFDGKGSPIKLNIPIRADGCWGDTWWDACKDGATILTDDKETGDD